MALAPFVFLAGPSGVGKSELLKWMQRDLHFLAFDIDRRHGFHANDLHKEWHRFNTQLEAAPLVACLRRRMETARAKGAVVSFPSTRILTVQQIAAGRAAGIETIMLWGSKEQCMAARRERDAATGEALDEARYDRSNDPAFRIYGASEYEQLRVAAFRADGSRWSPEEMIAKIQKRIAG